MSREPASRTVIGFVLPAAHGNIPTEGVSMRLDESHDDEMRAHALRCRFCGKLDQTGTHCSKCGAYIRAEPVPDLRPPVAVCWRDRALAAEARLDHIRDLFGSNLTDALRDNDDLPRCACARDRDGNVDGCAWCEHLKDLEEDEQP